MAHLLMKNAGQLVLIMENRRDFALWGEPVPTYELTVTLVAKGKIKVTL